MARRGAWHIASARIAPTPVTTLEPDGHTRLCVALDPCAGQAGDERFTLAVFGALMLRAGDPAFIVERAPARMVSLVFTQRAGQEAA
jgi:hypothetical protein